MSILYLGLFVVGCLLAMDFFAPKRNKPTARALRELGVLPVTTIAAARAGRVKLRGTARAERTEASLVGQVACLALRRSITTRQGNSVTTETREWTFPFVLEDGTGTLVVDAGQANLDYEPLTTGDTTEECLRDGATLAVIGDLVPAVPAGEGQAPFRFAKPPLVSWRCDPEDAPRGGLVPWRLVLGALLSLGGVAGAVHAYFTGWAEERDILVHVGPVIPFVLGYAAYRIFRKD
ncbi:MAG TPA: hypothetical protein VK762_32305 [Polyangiaceae bacterium]|nr:hypothetical protein [Polyangiaceae bacterium]